MSSGDICSCCNKGRVYKGESRKSLQFSGRAPIEVTRHEKQALRCNFCQKEFIATGRVDKWDHTAKTTVILHKVMGIPYYRLAKLQALYGIPVAPSTLYMLFQQVWEDAASHIYEALLKELSECNSYYVDDTGAIILEILQANKFLADNDKAKRACHTTVISSTTNDTHNIVVYITKNQYAGENLAPILENKTNTKSHIRLMSDASHMNIPDIEVSILQRVIKINCLSHARSKFKDIELFYPEECAYFLNEIAEIYQNDHHCQDKDYSSKKRLRYHQKHSKKNVDNIASKIEYLFNNRLIEPNSGLGKAMRYWRNHEEALTMFLCIRGIDLDNNISERLLKDYIIQRKNSMFNLTIKSAMITSGHTSIKATCVANNINPYEYFNWIQVNYKDVQKNPSNYLPWKYKKQMDDTELISLVA